MKLIFTKHPKTLHKLSKAIRQAEKVGSSSSSYSDTKKWKLFKQKNHVKITKLAHAFKSFASSYNVEILNSFNPELQLKDIESAITSKLIDLLSESKKFIFVAALVLVFRKIEIVDKTKYRTFYLSSKAEIIIDEIDMDDVFQLIYTTIITNIQKYLGKGSGWIFDSVIDHTINISKYNSLPGSSYIKLFKELDHPRNRPSSILKILAIMNALNALKSDT